MYVCILILPVVKPQSPGGAMIHTLSCWELIIIFTVTPVGKRT